MLIYVYMSNGSLASHLYSKSVSHYPNLIASLGKDYSNCYCNELNMMKFSKFLFQKYITAVCIMHSLRY